MVGRRAYSAMRNPAHQVLLSSHTKLVSMRCFCPGDSSPTAFVLPCAFTFRTNDRLQHFFCLGSQLSGSDSYSEQPTGVFPTPRKETSPTGAMPVRRRRGGRERGFGGRPPSIRFSRAASPALPRHLGKKQAQPERCRSAGVAEGGSGDSGAGPRASVSQEQPHRRSPDTSGRNKPNRSDAGLPASRRAGAGVRGLSPRAAVSGERPGNSLDPCTGSLLLRLHPRSRNDPAGKPSTAHRLRTRRSPTKRRGVCRRPD